jgi:hypothetical protein
MILHNIYSCGLSTPALLKSQIKLDISFLYFLAAEMKSIPTTYAV